MPQSVKLPPSIKKYFWDADVERFTLSKEGRYVIERIFEYGDEKAIRWLFHRVPRRFLVDALKRTRSLSPANAYLWANVLGVSKKSIVCLEKQFRERRSKHWIW